MSTTPRGPLAVVADRVRTIRKSRLYSAEQLAAEVTKLGVAWDRTGVTKLETRRRRTFTLEDLYAFALALNVSPLTLLTPEDEDEEVQVTPTVATSGKGLGMWVTGEKKLSDEGVRAWMDFVRELPHWKMVQSANLYERFTSAIEGSEDPQKVLEYIASIPESARADAIRQQQDWDDDDGE